jgi:hypothetical protein
MSRQELITDLRREGYFSVSDWIANRYCPGQTIASAYEVRDYCEGRGIHHPAAMINTYLGSLVGK